MSALISRMASQHIPVHCGQALGPMSKVLSEHVAEHPFVSTRLAVGAPENSTQKDHKPQRQKQIGQDQVHLTADDGARGHEEGPQADHQEASQEGKGTENCAGSVPHPYTFGTQLPDPATPLLPFLREDALISQLVALYTPGPTGLWTIK